MGARLSLLAGVLDYVEAQDAFSEITFVNFFSRDDFIDVLELRECEIFRHELECDGRVVEFGCEALVGHLEDLFVVEGQIGEFLQAEPADVLGIRSCFWLEFIGGDQGVIGHGDDPFAWIAVGSAEGIELLEVHACDAGLFLKFSSGTLLQALFHLDEAARQGPLVLMRGERPLNKEYFELVPADREDHDVGGDGGMRISVGKGHFRALCKSYTKISVLITLNQTVFNMFSRNSRYLIVY